MGMLKSESPLLGRSGVFKCFCFNNQKAVVSNREDDYNELFLPAISPTSKKMCVGVCSTLAAVSRSASIGRSRSVH